MTRKISLQDREKKDQERMNQIVSAFITPQDNEPKSVTKKGTETDTKSETESVSKNDTKHVTKGDTNYVTENDTETDTRNVTKHDTKNDTESVTNIVTKSVTKNVTYKKSINIGNIRLTSKYYDGENVKRNAYFLRENTIKMIEKTAKKTGIKKSELVDLILNSILSKNK